MKAWHLASVFIGARFLITLINGETPPATSRRQSPDKKTTPHCLYQQQQHHQQHQQLQQQQQQQQRHRFVFLLSSLHFVIVIWLIRLLAVYLAGQVRFSHFFASLIGLEWDHSDWLVVMNRAHGSRLKRICFPFSFGGGSSGAGTWEPLEILGKANQCLFQQSSF